MQKTLIIDTALERLASMVQEDANQESISLYGFNPSEVALITSTEPKKGLDQIGVVSMSDNSTHSDTEKKSGFSIEEGKLYHLAGPGEEKTEAEVIPYATDFNKRNHGIIPDSSLADKTVTVVGLGSGGSGVTLALARSGVRKIISIEYDTVSTSNICRSAYDVTDIGKKKTDAIYEKLIRINPDIDLQVYDKNILDMERETLLEIIEASDLIIDCTDNEKTKGLVNGLAHDEVPVLYPAVYEGGKGGEILMTMPGLPCYECVNKEDMTEGSEGDRKREWDYTTGEPKPMPGLLADIQVVVSRTVKLALGILTCESEHSFMDNITEPGCTLLLIGNENNFYLFTEPFQEIWAETEVNPECFCQTLQ